MPTELVFWVLILAGIFNTLVADPVKALTKEDWLPKGTSQFMHSLAPFLAVFPVIVSFAVIPFGHRYKSVSVLSRFNWLT